MKISVKTGGPVSDLPQFFCPRKETLADMINVISDEIDDTQSEYMEQIEESIFSAIRFCEREVFYFNESYDVYFQTKADCYAYGAKDCKELCDIGGILSLIVVDKGLFNAPLRRISLEDFSSLEASIKGQPRAYSYCNQEILLHPTPDKNYTIKLIACPTKFPDITQAGEKNPWFTYAFDMIKARAKYELYKNILQDMSSASVALNDFHEHFALLKAETSRRNGTSFIKATRF